FDLVSIAELRGNLGDLGRVLAILGPYWRVIYSDALEDDGGNDERLGFVYDKRAVAFTGFAPPRPRPAPGAGTCSSPGSTGGASPSWPRSAPAASTSCCSPRTHSGAPRPGGPPSCSRSPTGWS